jgi:hypothetical protein
MILFYYCVSDVILLEAEENGLIKITEDMVNKKIRIKLNALTEQEKEDIELIRSENYYFKSLYIYLFRFDISEILLISSGFDII